MQTLKSSICWIQMDSTFVKLLKVVANVQECSSLEGVSEVTDLGVGWDQAGEPIVGDTDCRDHLSLAAVLETGLAEYRNLLNLVCWLCFRIRAWEHISIVQEHYSYSARSTFVHT
jgi:hypothetical protein